MNEKYLGLPVHVGKSKTGAFAYLKDRIWKCIQGWNEKFLSWTGKEILIEAVALAIPTFAMGCFDLTKTFCDQLSTMICRYWWNQQEGKHQIPLAQQRCFDETQVGRGAGLPRHSLFQPGHAC